MADKKLPIQIGPYTLIYKLGEGGLANVYLGLKNKKGYAVKVLKSERLNNAKSVENFIREARIGSQIKHPSFSKVIDHGKVNQYHFLTMELVFGINVFDMVQYFRSYGKNIPLSITLYILKGSCEALRYLHDKTVFAHSNTKLFHGDLSPSNLMINQAGFFKMMDLGSSNQESTVKITKNHFGKLQFLPPEFFKGISPNQNFDIYAMAIIAYQMTYGALPFKASSKSDLVDMIKNRPVPLPDDKNFTIGPEQENVLKRFFVKALNKNPNKRHLNIKDFEKDLFLIQFAEKPIQSFHQASYFLRESFSNQLKTINQTWNDQMSFYGKYHQDQVLKKKKVEALVPPSDRRRHPRISISPDDHITVTLQHLSKQHIFRVLQLSRGGLLAHWENRNPPEKGDVFEIVLEFKKIKKFNMIGEVCYKIPQKEFCYVGFEFAQTKADVLTYIDQTIAQKDTFDDIKKDKLFHQVGMRNLFLYYPSKKILHRELTENIQHKRAMVISNTPFGHNSKVQLHLHALGTFQSGVFLATVVMCSKMDQNKYQLGIEIQVNQSTLDFLLEVSQE